MKDLGRLPGRVPSFPVLPSRGRSSIRRGTRTLDLCRVETVLLPLSYSDRSLAVECMPRLRLTLPVSEPRLDAGVGFEPTTSSL